MKLLFSALIALLTTHLHAQTISIMQYNVENLFDTVHDEAKNDWTYLPLSYKTNDPESREACLNQGSEYYVNECLTMDWTEKFLIKKFNAIGNVIKSYDESSKGPDIIVFQEVENLNVINLLIQNSLKDLGYNYTTLIEGLDERGIDVAIISKHPIKSAKLHSLNGLKTRGILEAVVSVKKKELTIFANHWPSQSNPVIQRIESAKLLEKLANKSSSEVVLAIGDFNMTSEDSPSPQLYMPSFIDTQEVARLKNPNLHYGTHFYRGEWSFLDRIFIHQKSKDAPNYSSFQVVKRPFMLKRDNYTGDYVPNRFNFRTGEGFSDHLPLGIQIKL